MTESNQEFEQSPAIEQLFQVYYRAAPTKRQENGACCGFATTNTEG